MFLQWACADVSLRQTGISLKHITSGNIQGHSVGLLKGYPTLRA